MSTPEAWQSFNAHLSASSATLKAQSSQLRSQAAQSIRQTEAQLTSRDVDVNDKFSDRLSEIQQWNAKLEEIKDNIHAEIGHLIAGHDELTAYLEFIEAIPLDVHNNNVAARDQRVGIDKVKDAVEVQLGIERDTLHQAQDVLHGTLNDTETALHALRNSLAQINDDINGKQRAAIIDNSCVGLTKTSHSLHVDTNTDVLRQTLTATSSRTYSVKDWLSFSRNNVDKAKQDISDAQKLFQTLSQALKFVLSSVQQQSQVVADALAKRAGEVASALSAIEKNIELTKKEIKDQKANIETLEDSVKAKEGPLKLTITRLDSRFQRPNVELVEDKVHNSLLNAVDDIERTRSQLANTQFEAQSTLAQLHSQLELLQEQHRIKTATLGIENACIAYRALHKSRVPRATDYALPRTQKEWTTYGRTRNFHF